MDRDISIFLDTNIIQVFLESKKGTASKVFLDRLEISQEYYTLTKFIERNNLKNKIEICIPEIVVMEMKQHMKEGFKKQLQLLENQIQESKKRFGNLADFSTVKVKYAKGGYANQVNSLFSEFFNNPKNYAKQILFPRHISILETLVSKAVSGERPFFVGKIESKNHTDAGFKDSVIAETIYEYSKKHNRMCVFITQDRDFSPNFKNTIQADSKLVIFDSIGTAVNALEEYYVTDSYILREFTKSEYWHKRLLAESSMEYDASVTECQVNDISRLENNLFVIKMMFVINEAEYHFAFKFDSKANDISDLKYYITND